jgi:hypothetical protein
MAQQAAIAGSDPSTVSSGAAASQRGAADVVVAPGAPAPVAADSGPAPAAPSSAADSECDSDPTGPGSNAGEPMGDRRPSKVEGGSSDCRPRFGAQGCRPSCSANTESCSHGDGDGDGEDHASEGSSVPASGDDSDARSGWTSDSLSAPCSPPILHHTAQPEPGALVL